MYPYSVEQRVAKLKETYPSILVIEVEDRIKNMEDELLFIVARPLSMSEFNTALLMGSRNENQSQEWVVSTTVNFIWAAFEEEERDLSTLPLGAIPTIFTSVMEESSFLEVESLIQTLQEFRYQSDSIIYEGAKYIMKAFPQYKLKDIKNLTRTEFAELIMMSEKIHETTFSIIDPSQMPTEESKNNRQLRGIAKVAEENNKLFDFGKDNAELSNHM